MTREEAIRWLEDIHRRFNPTGENLENEGGDVHLQALDMAIDALKIMQDTQASTQDLISRQDAIEAVAKATDPFGRYDKQNIGIDWALDALKALPSEELALQTPQTYGKGINPSNAEVVEDYISRADAIEAVENNSYGMGSRASVKAIKALPSAEAVQGKWIPVSEKPKDEKRTYLVQLDSGGMRSCRWTNANPIWTELTTDWHWNIFDIPQYCKVVAWMDLEPYRDDMEEYELATEQMEHDALYEPTYNSEDGSM